MQDKDSETGDRQCPAPHSSHSAGHDLTAITADSVSVSLSSGNYFYILRYRKYLQAHGGHLERPLQDLRVIFRVGILNLYACSPCVSKVNLNPVTQIYRTEVHIIVL